MASYNLYLNLTAFFLADIRDGLGPYLSIYLLTEHSLSPSSIGLVLSASGIASLAFQPLAGALVDRTHRPRSIIASACGLVTVSCLAIPFARWVPMLCALQGLAGAAAGVFGPAMADLALGCTGGGGREFSRRIGRNEMYNHFGNGGAALSSGVLSVWSGRAVFWLMAGNAVCAMGSVCLVPTPVVVMEDRTGTKTGSSENKNKDDAGKNKGKGSGSIGLFGDRNRPLLVFALCLALFHLANAAMLPLVGQKLAAIYGPEHATMLTSSAIVGAQFVMAPVSRLVGSKTDSWGRRPLLLLGFLALPIRGLLLSLSNNMYFLLAVQLLDGLGVGVLDTLLPLIVRDVVGEEEDGGGGGGAVMGTIATVQGVGAAMSNSLAGGVVEVAGFDVAFRVLGFVAALAWGLVAVAMPETGRRGVGAGAGAGGCGWQKSKRAVD